VIFAMLGVILKGRILKDQNREETDSVCWSFEGQTGHCEERDRDQSEVKSVQV